MEGGAEQQTVIFSKCPVFWEDPGFLFLAARPQSPPYFASRDVEVIFLLCSYCQEEMPPTTFLARKLVEGRGVGVYILSPHPWQGIFRGAGWVYRI